MGIKKIKIAIIGAGYMADEHLKVLTKLQNVELVGIFNRTKKNAMKLKKKYKIQLMRKIKIILLKFILKNFKFIINQL